MTIQRSPHVAFAAYWGLWWLATLYVFLTGEQWTWWLVSFLVPEALASLWDTGRRDTLSEVMTWFQRKLSKHTRFASGWNAFILLLLDVLSFAAVRPLWGDHERIVFIVQVPILVALLIRWLWDHWVRPDLHG